MRTGPAGMAAQRARVSRGFSPIDSTTSSYEAGSGPRRKGGKRNDCLEAAGLLFVAALCLGYLYALAQPQKNLHAGEDDIRQHLESTSEAASSSYVGRFGGEADAGRLLLASHNRLLWYYYRTGKADVLHEGEGVYYGVFPGVEKPGRSGPASVWVVSRPHNWHPTTTEEKLLELDIDNGDELRRMTIPGRFTHDAARRDKRVYLCSTDGGSILQYTFPDMKLLPALDLFTKDEHVNSVAPLEPHTLWVVLHNRGPSELAKVDLRSGKEVGRVKGVGSKAHNIMRWGKWLLVLDSDAGALMRVDPDTGLSSQLWKAEDQKFLKGLAVVDGVAYFGVSVFSERSARGDPVNSDLAAFDLGTEQLLWRKEVPTHGLLNTVSAPHLAVASTYMAIDTRASNSRDGQLSSSVVQRNASLRGHIRHKHRQMRENSLSSWQGRSPADTLRQFPPKVGGHWSSGMPRLCGNAKRVAPLTAGVQLDLLTVDVSSLKAAVLALPPRDWSDVEQQRSNAWFEGRSDNMQRFKRGVDTIVLLFSDQAGRAAYRFPWYHKFREHLDPILEQVVGRGDVGKVMRVQVARVPAGGEVRAHQDMGGWVARGHRIHIPLTTPAGVSFLMCPRTDTVIKQHAMDGAADCWPLAVAEGRAFELNNMIPHKVLNRGQEARIHLILDFGEIDFKPVQLKPGQRCGYRRNAVTCDLSASQQ